MPGSRRRPTLPTYRRRSGWSLASLTLSPKAGLSPRLRILRAVATPTPCFVDAMLSRPPELDVAIRLLDDHGLLVDEQSARGFELALANLLQDLVGPDRGAGTYEDTRGRVAPGARRKLHVLLLGMSYPMARIGPSDPNQHLVFAGDVSNDVALAFAAILPADENVDEFDRLCAETDRDPRRREPEARPC